MAEKPKERRRMRPATSPEQRESQLMSLATDLAEKQLIEGTASAQVITHYLKMASSRERLEQERLQRENLLLTAKVEQIASGKRIEELYEDALHAMKTYSGREEESFEDFELFDDD